MQHCTLYPQEFKREPSLLVRIVVDTLPSMSGRPKNKPGELKDTHVRIRVTKSERAEITRRAKAAKAKSESEWIRERLLGDD